MMLSYAWVNFGGGDFKSFTVGQDGVETITWRENNFLFVVYDDRAMVLNLNQARYVEIKETPTTAPQEPNPNDPIPPTPWTPSRTQLL